MKLRHPGSPDRETLRKAGPAMSLGYTIAAAMIVLPLAGGWIGGRFGHSDGGVLVGLGLGLLYSGYELWKVVRYLNKASDQEAGKPPKP